MPTPLPNKAQTGLLAALLSPWFKFLCLRTLLNNNIKKDIIKILLHILHYSNQTKKHVTLEAEFGVLTLSNTGI